MGILTPNDKYDEGRLDYDSGFCVNIISREAMQILMLRGRAVVYYRIVVVLP